ncbi:bifunctional (p)ppGpp synthetase/guanosine-3',5'-bis(diphosphate) 3'-pyrophosphohydrolase [Sphingorhabdus lutea]|uniref:GTP pyrophosphokinase rsh n=1 Tax=Sphingorhabdus lutea TaxID=1913578 RepID=A0A1L3JDV6_9SPHN|nr:bifunctional (p)ppGpp synthetase/guanosine-3',5'-bis(diphosphate) 3'-pyrophosphohydrolase [Sphingorhabdus lutea]APG63296.1 bifunctional (p)ppGpp synthetase/guanosine-3',5'-bis(diphosphate) 3'-pyrophosphohydrolase [Sphingorhabdus lutea]
MLRQYELVERVMEYAPDADEDRLNRAYVFTVQKHGSQKRASGDPYFSHPVEVAGLMTDLQMDEETIITALLHDTVEDTLTTIEEVSDKFGPEVARLVDGVTKLSKIEAQSEDQRAAENLRKFLLAISDDIRVLLVKLADRLHNMRTLNYIKSPLKRARIAKETMDIYAPLAERIGMYEYMREMQLLAFEQLEPDACKTITDKLAQIRVNAGAEVSDIAASIQKQIIEGGIDASVSGREKHPYSIWRKMQERHVTMDQMADINAFRIVTNSEEDCYKVLGRVHRKWKMVPGRFKDYISTPKRNGYRSIHTTIMFAQNMRVEVQIRSKAMHEQSEFGLAAHWGYKTGDRPDGQAGWIRDLIEILETSHDAEDLLENTRLAMYQDRIFAFTPKGALHQLPKGATPVDFAYAVHTDLGDKTVGAKVNGRHVPLRTILANGDMVDILKSDGQLPQANWLNFVATGKARAAVRRSIRMRERSELVELGRQIYGEIIAHYPSKIGKKALAKAMERLEIEDESQLMVDIASGKIADKALLEALIPGYEDDPDLEWPQQNKALTIKGLTPGLAYQLGECCHPIPGDRIVGLRRANEPVQVHMIDCETLANGQDADWVDLSWGRDSDGATARLHVIVHNRPGSLADIANIFAYHKANIMNLKLGSRDTEFHSYELDLEVHDLHHFMRILSALRAVDAVSRADRVH